MYHCLCGRGTQAVLPRADGAGGGHALQRLCPPRHCQESAYLCQLAGPQGPLPPTPTPSLPDPHPLSDLLATDAALLPSVSHYVLHNCIGMLQLLSESHHSCPVRLSCSCQRGANRRPISAPRQHAPAVWWQADSTCLRPAAAVWADSGGIAAAVVSMAA